MAILPLRAYNRDIEGLVENGQLDEAVAHCRHILSTFPKHIATYRLLGKAHLEQQRISDATDIFQRVLSAIPDDFISNVGMSIIREDENNLDASIWHMELAYEAQPSNVAIQEELRRLYGRRDGAQPPKVRLTRGALAKMYAKGGLYDQAVAELRAAIAEDPNRPDLQLLLAQMYFQISQRVEAVETCVTILKKLPFCLAANQILAVCLPETEGSDAGKNYRQIAISMDPYFAFAAPDAISSDLVSENSVNVERLEWKPGIQATQAPTQPSWATSLGISLDKPSDEKLPDWLQGADAPIEPAESGPGNVSPFIWDTQEVEKIITDASKPEDEIPGWMKDAGWSPATEETLKAEKEAPSAPAPVDETQPEDLARAEIPEWLRGIAPSDMLEQKPGETTEDEKDTSLPWLQKQQPGPTDTIIQWLETKEPEKPALPIQPEATPVEETQEEIPDWLKDLEQPAPEEPKEPQPTEVRTPMSGSIPAFTDASFLSEPIETENPATPPEAEIPAPGEGEQLSEAQQSIEVPKEELPAAFSNELPDWIKELAADSPKPAAFTPGEEQPADELAFLKDQAPAEEPGVAGPEEQPLEWFTEDTPVRGMPAPQDELQAEAPAIPGKETTEETPTDKIEPALAFEVPDVMQAAEEEIAPQPAVEIPDWIKGLGEIMDEATPEAEEAIEPEAPTNPEVEIPKAQELPDWLSELEKPEGADIATHAEPFDDTTPPTSEAEALKAEALPDWLSELDKPKAAEIATHGEPFDDTTPPVIPDAEVLKAETLPSWLSEMEKTDQVEGATEAEQPTETPPAASQETEITKAEEIPTWVNELDKPDEASTTPAPEAETQAEPLSPVSSDTEASKTEELPSWILELDKPEEAEKSDEAEAPVPEGLEWKEEELPDWIKEIAEAAPVQAVQAITEPVLSEEKQAEASERLTEWKPEDAQVPEAVQMTAEQPAPVEEMQVSEEVIAPTISEAELAPVTEAGAGVEQVAEVPEQVEKIPTPAVETQAIETDQLTTAREAVARGESDQAADAYTVLIKKDLYLEDVIKDLQEALYRFPVDIRMWVTLGDAFMHSNDLQEALNTYRKAEDLVR